MDTPAFFDDPRPSLAAATERAAAAIAAVRPEQFDAPTPCPEFTVRDLISHMTGVLHKFAVIGEGGDGLAVASRVDGVADGGWPEAFAAARARIADAWGDDALLGAKVRVPWGEVPGAGALAGCVMETVQHTWDLDRATGAGVGPDDALAAVVLEQVGRRFLADAPRGAGGPFGPVHEVAEDAPGALRLAGWLGRDPEWAAA